MIKANFICCSSVCLIDNIFLLFLFNCIFRYNNIYIIFDRPGVAGAVLQTASSFIN